MKKIDAGQKRAVLETMDAVLGLQLLTLSREALRIRPATAMIAEDAIEATLARRKDARAAKDFAASDALRDELIAARSEEHTSELQSLMRISYAVFCLKKKNNK